MAMGLKLPEMPFCLGFAAALLALGGSWKNLAVRLVAGGAGGALGFALFSAPWMWSMYQQTGNPIFPYFNYYWKSPLVHATSYRDLRFVPGYRPWWQQLFFPLLFSYDFHVADDLGFQDIRVALAYLLVPAAVLIWLARRQSRDPLLRGDAVLPLFAFAAASYFEWLRTFAIYRYIVLLEMLSPLLIVGAVGLMPASRRVRYIALGVLCFAVLLTARSDFLEHARLPGARAGGRSLYPGGVAAHPPSRTHHGDHGRRRAHGLHRHAAAACHSGPAHRRLSGAAQGRHPAQPPDADPGRCPFARRRRPVPDGRHRRHDARPQRREGLPACHSLARVPAIRHKPGGDL